jgi:hypothetical protein
MKTFTLKELCDKCAELMPEYIKEPGIIYFEFLLLKNYCERVTFSSMAERARNGYFNNRAQKYYCFGIKQEGLRTYIRLKPVE